MAKYDDHLSGSAARRDPVQADLRGRQGRGACAAPRLVRRDRARNPRSGRRPLDHHDPGRLRASPEAGLLSLARVPDRPPAERVPGQSAARTRPARPRWPGSASISTGSARSSPTPRSATAASGGSPPASWRAWRPSASPASATASATSTACSGSVFDDGWQVEQPEDWLAFGNPWEFERPEVAYEIGFGGTRRARGLRGRPARTTSGARPSACMAIAYDTPIVGWRGRHGQHAPAVVGAAAPIRCASTQFNRGDYLGRGRRAGHRGEHRPGALPERRHARRPGAAPASRSTSSPRPRCRTCCAAIMQQSRPASAALPDKVGDPAQRHPSGDRRRRADAPPGGRCTASTGTQAWEITQRLHSPTPTTRCCPRRSRRWPVALLERAAAAPSADHLRHQRRFLLTRERAWPATSTRGARSSLIDEGHGRRVRMAHLAIVGAHTVNGVSALHTELMKQTVFARLRPRSIPDRIINKTNGITPRRWLLPVQSRRSSRADHASASATGWIDDLERLQRARARWPTTPASASAFAAGQAGQQGAPRRT